MGGGVEGFGMSVPLEGISELFGDGFSETSSDGDGLGDSDKSPKIFVGPERVGFLKSLYGSPSCI